MYPHQIFIVEDDEDDQNLISNAFSEISKADLIRFFNNGSQLMEHLDRLSGDNQPSLIVLDYNMPLQNGAEVLHQIRKHHLYQFVPVVVYSTGFTPGILKELQELNALTCLQKGAQFEKLVQQARFFTELIADDLDTLIGNY